jgi:hypothetical protein
MEKTKENPNKYTCSNPKVLPSCENEKLNIEKQADLVEETAFENLKVKKPITYTGEELKSKLKTLLNESISYPENFITGVCLDSSKLNHWFEQNRKK